MKKTSTAFLKACVWSMGAAALIVLVCVVPLAIWAQSLPTYRSILISLYVPAIPFFIVLKNTLDLLRNIDKNLTFSQESVTALRRIKLYSALCGVLFLARIVGVFCFSYVTHGDTPSALFLGMAFVALAPLVIAVFASVLQQLLQNAIDIKQENDLTV